MTTFVSALLLSGAPVRPVATYSIVARDPQTGDLGVAVQSHWFSVGSVVSWAEAGVGAVATQSFPDPAYGPLGLTLMRAGKSAPEAPSPGPLAASSRRTWKWPSGTQSPWRPGASWTPPTRSSPTRFRPTPAGGNS